MGPVALVPGDLPVPLHKHGGAGGGGVQHPWAANAEANMMADFNIRVAILDDVRPPTMN